MPPPEAQSATRPAVAGVRWWLRPGAFWRACRQLGPAMPLFVWSTLGPVLGVLALAACAEVWLGWFGDAPGVFAAVCFWLGAALLAALCLVPTHATSLVAGYLFGVLAGSLLAGLVVLLASVLGFAGFRRVVGSRVLDALARSERAVRVHDALLGRGPLRTVWLIALLRLSPVMPFAATNLLMAALFVRSWVFLAATVLGVAPRAVAAAFVGAELSELDWGAGVSGVWPTALAIGATLLLLVVVGWLARAALRRQLPEAGA